MHKEIGNNCNFAENLIKRMKKTGLILICLLLFCGVSAQDILKNDSVQLRKASQVADTTKVDSAMVGNLHDLLNDEDLKPMERPLSVNDTLSSVEKTNEDVLIKNDSLTLRLDVVMPMPEEIDSLTADTVLLGDSVHIVTDSLHSNALLTDSLLLDSLVLDSAVIDTLTFDSAFYYKQQQAIRDSLIQDSIRLKKLADAERRKLIPQSVIEYRKLLANYHKEFKQMFALWDEPFDWTRGTKMKPEYFKLVVPLTYYSSAIGVAGNFDEWEPDELYTRQARKRDKEIQAQVPCVMTSMPIYNSIERQLLSFYVAYPELVEHNEAEFMNLTLLSEEEMTATPRTENVLNMIQPSAQVERVSDSDLVVYRPNFWTKGGSGYLQFSQNHISDNWYKGGESTKSLLAGLTSYLNFNNKQGIEFENKLEWKLGFITAPSDTLHSYKANNDLFRLTSKFGLRAIKHWYYTLSFDFKTQLFSSYQTNTDNLVSAFFSPAELNVGLGMDYKYTKNNVCNLSFLMTPFNYTLYTVTNDEVDPTKFNIKEGRKHASVFGSRVEATVKWKIMKPLIWESRFSYTTNYEKVLADWENTFTFVVNKYLSTKLFVHARFDDGVSRKDDQSYFQLQEILSFGLNYTW